MNDPIGEKPFDLAMAQRIFQSQIPHCRELADAPDDWVASCVAAFLADNGGATEDETP